MKRKSLKVFLNIMFLTFLLILLSFQNIFSQQKQFPVWLEIHPLAWRYFQLLDKDTLVELIKDELEKSFNNAYKDFTLVRIKAAVENNNPSCEYRHLFPHWSLPSGTQLSQPWQYDGTPKFSIARAYPKRVKRIVNIVIF